MGHHWGYEFNNNNILEECYYYESPIAIPRFIEIWVFKPVNNGEVSIRWISYYAGSEIFNNECYTENYIVRNGKIYKE